MDFNTFLFIVGRVLFGGFFLVMASSHFMKHGMLTQYTASKNVPSPSLAVYGSGVLLFIGGLSIITGAFIWLGALALTVFFVPVSFKMHNFWAISDPQDKMMQMVNFMKNMAFLGATLMLLMIERPWSLSLF